MSNLLGTARNPSPNTTGRNGHADNTQHSNSRKVLNRIGTPAETARGCARGTVDSS